MRFIFLFVVVLSLISGCSQTDTEQKTSDYISYDTRKSLDGYLGGDINSISVIDYSLYFTDIANRQITTLDLVDDVGATSTFGSRGRGPGEYEFPLELVSANNEFLAWSDITKSEITIADTNGELVQTIVHPYGGGRKFSLNDEFLLVTPGFSHLINIVEIENVENRTELFELSSRDRAFTRAIPGGGGLLSNDKAIAFLPHKPVFHIYDLKEKEESEFVPPVFQTYYDTYNSYIENINRPSDIITEELYESLLIINRVHKLEYENESMMLIEASYQAVIRLYVFDSYLNLVFSSESSFSPLGTSGSVIFGAQVSKDDDAVVSILSKDLSGYLSNPGD